MHSIYEKLLTGLRRKSAAIALVVGTLGCLTLMRFVDQPLAQHFQAHTGVLFHIAACVTKVGEAIWWLLPSFALYLAARILWRSPLWAGRALFVFAAVAGSGLLVDALKPLLGRARPVLLFTQHVYGFSYLHFAAVYESFPSGHAACATSAGLALGRLAPRYRALWITVGLLVGLTRVIVTAHYLSDVLAAVLVAGWTVFALERLFARHGVRVGAAHSVHLVTQRSALALRLLGQGLLRPPEPVVAPSAVGYRGKRARLHGSP
jgi:membrane-associated phospholipid phosphatase